MNDRAAYKENSQCTDLALAHLASMDLVWSAPSDIDNPGGAESDGGFEKHSSLTISHLFPFSLRRKSPPAECQDPTSASHIPVSMVRGPYRNCSVVYTNGKLTVRISPV
jgi:hypothetical protein